MASLRTTAVLTSILSKCRTDGEGGCSSLGNRQSNDGPNQFVETTLQYVLTYIPHLPLSSASSDPSAPLSGILNITILADDAYYSTKSNLRRSGKFTNFGISLSKAHKTGLGSSAALVTALTAALIATFTPSMPTAIPEVLQKRIHNLAQAAHCAAQGKVGSGFDVAAAVYGSCLYRRFSPTVLESVGDPYSTGFGERLHLCVEDLELDHAWDMEVLRDAVRVPQSLRLVMCDVDCGSETPGMVKRVLNWRKEKPDEAALLWGVLQRGQEDLCAELKRLTRLDGLSSQIGSNLGDGPQDPRGSLVGDGETFTELKDVIETIRSLVREMSEKSGVPIEPKVLTGLLDACSAAPGVVGGFCPGAGGYDAVALLVKNDEAVLKNLRSSLAGWESGTETGSGPVIGKVNLLDVQQDMQGLRVEDPSSYREWTGP
jgi:phosphomevalonate kinase